MSQLYVLEDGASTDISIVGNDGPLGLTLFNRAVGTRPKPGLLVQSARPRVSPTYYLCRWLLLSLDRLPSNELTMTHELIANMLGVRREGVTAAVGKLQRFGVINHSRGHITVLDRPALERLSCECYAVVKRETDPACSRTL